MTIEAAGPSLTPIDLTTKKEETIQWLNKLAEGFIAKIEEIQSRTLTAGSSSSQTTPETLNQKITQLNSDSQSDIHAATTASEIDQKHREFIYAVQELKSHWPKTHHGDLSALIAEHRKTYQFEQTKAKCIRQFHQYIRKIQSKLDKTHKKYFPSHAADCSECFASIKQNLEQVSDDFQTQLLFAEDKKGLEELLKNSIEELLPLDRQWPIALHRFEEIKKQAREKISFIINEFKIHLVEEDQRKFDAFIEEIDKISADSLQKLEELLEDAQKENHILDRLTKINNILDAINLERESLSLLDFRDKIIARTYNIRERFPDMDFTETVATIRAAVAETDRTNSLSIQNTLDKLQEIDMEIEKQAAIAEIRLQYEKIIQVITDFEKSGISLQPQREYIEEGVNDSTVRLGEIQIHHHATGLNEIAQLFLVINGTLSQLARALKDIYTRFGKESIIQSLQQLSFNDQSKDQTIIVGDEGQKVLKKTEEQIVENFMDAITWGNDNSYRPCPPLLPEDKMMDIISEHMNRAVPTLYLCYFEQCIKKSLKFFLLRKKFEALSEGELKKLEEQGNILCLAAKEAATQLLNANMRAKQPEGFLERKIESLIGSYIQKIHQLASSSDST